MHLPLSHSTIRSLRPADAPSIARHVNDAEVCRYLLLVPYPYALTDAESWIAQVSAESPEVNFGIDLGGEIVGGIGLQVNTATAPGAAPHSAEIGYWLGRAYWGRGVVTEAVAALTAWAFSELRLKRLHAGVFGPNVASTRVLTKAGYEYEGRRRAHYHRNGQFYDGLMYARLNPEDPPTSD
jgi:ribosomal-protein-alanine N-acetyltransferase